LFARFVREVPKGPPDWRNLEAARDHIEYPNYPTLGIAELRDLLAVTRAALPEVRKPVLLIHSKVDEGVPPVNMDRIFDNLGASDKQMLWVENSGHVIVREPEREQVFQAIEGFISRITNQSTAEER
jgi:carboxylesterase